MKHAVIIRRGIQNPVIIKTSASYKQLNENRKQWLNLIPWDQYKKEYL